MRSKVGDVAVLFEYLYVFFSINKMKNYRQINNKNWIMCMHAARSRQRAREEVGKEGRRRLPDRRPPKIQLDIFFIPVSDG